jgi:uncharacterized protein (TIGR03086 family)
LFKTAWSAFATFEHMKTTNLHAEMAAAAAEAARVVSGAPSAPDATSSLDARTPCTDWDLRTLLNHTILWTSYSAERRAHGESVAQELMTKDFTAEPGYQADYAAQIGRAVQAWSDPKAWEGDIGVMGDATPAADVGAMLIMEMALHGWDVARATGQEYVCDDAVAAAVLDTVEAQAELFRKYQGFKDIVPVPDRAPTFDRALSLSGRDPQWRPPR